MRLRRHLLSLHLVHFDEAKRTDNRKTIETKQMMMMMQCLQYLHLEYTDAKRRIIGGNNIQLILKVEKGKTLNQDLVEKPKVMMKMEVNTQFTEVGVIKI